MFSIRGFDGYMSRDLGLYGYGGQLLADGVLPYVGIFERGGPLTQFLPGIGVVIARAFGFDDILGMRLLFLGFAVASVGLIYVFARDMYRSRKAGLVAASAMVGFEGFNYFAANGPRAKTAMVVFLVAALVAALHQRWVMLGVFVSLATLVWQPVFVIAAAGTIPVIVLGVERGKRSRAFARVAVGGLLPAVLVVGVYAFTGHLRALLDGFILVHARYSTNTSFFDATGLNLYRLWAGYGVSLVLLILGITALGWSAISGFDQRGDKREFEACIAIGLGCLTMTGLAWTLFDFDNFPDVYVLLPSAALGLGFAGARAEERHRTPRLAVVIVAIAVTSALVLPIRHPAIGLSHQRAAVAAILGAIPGDDETILSVEAPQPLVLSHKRNPSRFQLFGSGAVDYVNEVWPGGIRGYARWVEKQAPTLIAVGIQGIPEWLSSTLDRYYWRAGEAPGWDWYVENDIGENVRIAIRKAIVSAR